MPGKVYLVGAGPGDPGLITVKGRRCLEQAEVVVYDRLMDPSLLEAAPRLRGWAMMTKSICCKVLADSSR